MAPFLSHLIFQQSHNKLSSRCIDRRRRATKKTTQGLSLRHRTYKYGFFFFFLNCAGRPALLLPSCPFYSQLEARQAGSHGLSLRPTEAPSASLTAYRANITQPSCPDLTPGETSPEPAQDNTAWYRARPFRGIGKSCEIGMRGYAVSRWKPLPSLVAARV